MDKTIKIAITVLALFIIAGIAVFFPVYWSRKAPSRKMVRECPPLPYTFLRDGMPPLSRRDAVH